MSPASSTPPASPPSPGRHSLGRRLLVGFLVLVVALAVLLAGSAFYLYNLLQRQGIDDIQIQFESAALDHLALERLTFIRLPSEAHQGLNVQAQGLRLEWHWRNTWLPRLELLQLQDLQISLDAFPSQDRAFLAHQKLTPQGWVLPGWLPRQILVENLLLLLTCADGVCQLNGSARLAVQKKEVSALLQLDHDGHPLEIRLQGALSDGVRMHGEILADGLPVAQIQGELQSQEQGRMLWQGQGKVRHDAFQPWLLEWLSQWQPQLARVSDLSLPPGLEVSGEWNLDLPGHLDDAGLWPALSGVVRLHSRLEEAIPVPLVDAVQGELKLDLSIRAGQLDSYGIWVDAQLARLPGAEYLARFPGLDPGPLRVVARSQGSWLGLESTRPTLQLHLESSGELTGEGQGEVMVSLQAPFTLELRESSFQLRSQQVALTPEVRLENAAAYLEVQGGWGVDGYQVEFSPASWITADRLELPLASLEQARLEAESFSLTGQDGPPQIQGQLRLATPRLVQEQLHPQAWQTQGKLSYDSHTWRITGTAQAHSGLTGEYSFLHQPGQPMKLEWQIGDLYFLAANPLPATLKQWPELLEISRGKLAARGQVLFPGEEEDLQLEVGMQLRDLGGIYDRTLVDGLSGDLQFFKQGEGFMLTADSIRVESLNPGFSMGPLQLEGSYASGSSDLWRGMVALRKMELELFGGRVWAEPISFDLSDKPVEVSLLIRDIDLARVLELYASQDLNGHGTLDGSLPLMISSQGISVAAGNLYARPPGGVLRYSHAQVRNMARNDARMEVLAEVLENFHYSLLSSDIAYGDDGQLTLGVQLQGRNPRMQNSPPVHLNINVEENLPMLLASLQMASNLSDTVKKRVSEALRQRQATKSP